MRILLVEDEAPLRETLAARLKRDGFAVDAAQDGEEGIYMGREVPFDLAIIDLGLPKMSGMELVNTLRFTTGIRATTLSSTRLMALPMVSMSRRCATMRRW